MTAPKAKKISPKEKQSATVDESMKKLSDEKGIQFVVFAPVNADPDDEDSRIYMVCPASLKVVEVVEKSGEEADEYLTRLGKTKKKTEQSSSTFIDDLGDAVDVDDSLVQDGSGYSAAKKKNDDEEEVAGELGSFEDIEEDVVAFANDSLLDIFPDDGSSGDATSAVSDVDMADALALLDQDDEVGDIELDDFSDDDGELPSL